MSQELVLNLARESLTTALLLAAPALVLSLVVGVGISIIQASTQIQEQTLTFVPKIIVVFLGVLVLGTWMLNTLVSFAHNILGNLSSLIG